MSEEGIQDLIGVMNITLKGAEDLGKIGMSATKGGINTVANICKLLKWIAQSIQSLPYHKTGGKVSMKVMGTKFQDLNYNEFKLSLVETKLKEKEKTFSGANSDIKKAKTLLSEAALKKKVEELSKKYGLVYSRVPNFMANKDTGKEEYRIAFPKSQTEAYQEVTAQLYAYMDKALKKVIGNEKERKAIIGQVIPECKPLTAALGEVGVTEVTNEQFDKAMKETYPAYDSKAIAAKEPSEEKKTDYIGIADRNEYAQQKAKGNVKAVSFSNVLAKNPSEHAITVVMDQYPNAAVKIKEADVLDLDAQLTEEGKVTYKAALRKDAVYEFEVYQADPITNKVDFTKNPKHYRMSLKDFDNMMKQNAAKTRQKAAKLLETKAPLHSVKTIERKQ